MTLLIRTGTLPWSVRFVVQLQSPTVLPYEYTVGHRWSITVLWERERMIPAWDSQRALCPSRQVDDDNGRAVRSPKTYQAILRASNTILKSWRWRQKKQDSDDVDFLRCGQPQRSRNCSCSSNNNNKQVVLVSTKPRTRNRGRGTMHR